MGGEKPMKDWKRADTAPVIEVAAGRLQHAALRVKVQGGDLRRLDRRKRRTRRLASSREN
jgi:hypothetical protein